MSSHKRLLMQKDANATKLDHAEEILRVPLVAHHEAAKVVQPREQALDLPPTTIAPQRPSVLPLRCCRIRAMRRDQFDALVGNFKSKPIAVVRVTLDQALRDVVDEARGKRLMHERHLMRRSASEAYGERKTGAVCDRRDLGALAALGLSDARAPFFAEANVPSKKHSRTSRPPRSRRSAASASSKLVRTPARFHA